MTTETQNGIETNNADGRSVHVDAMVRNTSTFFDEEDTNSSPEKFRCFARTGILERGEVESIHCLDGEIYLFTNEGRKMSVLFCPFCGRKSTREIDEVTLRFDIRV